MKSIIRMNRHVGGCYRNPLHKHTSLLHTIPFKVSSALQPIMVCLLGAINSVGLLENMGNRLCGADGEGDAVLFREVGAVDEGGVDAELFCIHC